ncbi:MAG: N-formylglutamate amidohydrolase [Cycloclasticus sp.]|nr:N-formylglutamate amidohydrolase [Cycloclasticus sp.]
MNAFQYPEWVVLHVPHDSQMIPRDVLSQFVINEDELKCELINMTDHFTYELYCAGVHPDQAVKAPVSRLVVDVERFEDDTYEMMAERGMGAIYMSSSQLQPLRREITQLERKSLLDQYYHPHHLKLTQSVDRLLKNHGHAFLLDCHSFPSKPLPYEFDTADQKRTDICLGTDSFHTPKNIIEAFATEFEKQGLSVAINTPFSGTLVPQKHYQSDSRVTSLMIEVNRALYLDEITGYKASSFQSIQIKVRESLHRAFASVGT